MNRQPSKEVERLLAQEASEWLEKVRSGTARAEGLDAWLAQSPLHADAFLKTLAVDAELDRAGEEARKDPGRQVNVPELLRMVGGSVVPFTHHPVLPQVEKPRRGRAWKLGAALVATVAVAAVGLIVSRYRDDAARTRVATSASEQRMIKLPDSSRVTLNTSSELRVTYTDASREIELRGEGFFRVARDTERPFFVNVPAARVRAVGTQFNVAEHGKDGAVVSVLEGQVEVVPILADGSARTGQLLSAGEQLEIQANGRILRPSNREVARAAAWQARRLPLEGATLEDLVTEFNRYGSVPFRIEGTVAPIRFGGLFDATDPESLAQYLSREPELIVERRGDVFVIRARPAGD